MNIIKLSTHLWLNSIKCLFQGHVKSSDVFKAIDEIGLKSLPIIAIATAFAGIVITDEMVWHMKGAVDNISITPGLTGQFIFRELAIAIASLLLVSKAGASIAAEISSMKLSEQLDALHVLKIDPVQYLVAPKFLASIISTIGLSFFSICITLLFSALMASFQYGFNFMQYLEMVRQFSGFLDLICAFVKSCVFGSIIPVIASAYGFQCRPGSKALGEATTQAVVSTTVLIIFLDLILSYLFTLID